MFEPRQIVENFTASPQIGVEDVPKLKEMGFVKVVCNRPDGEEAGQPLIADIQQAIEAEGIAFAHIPIKQPTAEAVAETRTVLESTDGPILGFCRTGTRSTILWALAEAQIGKKSADEVIAAGKKGGYDLSGLRAAFAGQ